MRVRLDCNHSFHRRQGWHPDLFRNLYFPRQIFQTVGHIFKGNLLHVLAKQLFGGGIKLLLRVVFAQRMQQVLRSMIDSELNELDPDRQELLADVLELQKTWLNVTSGLDLGETIVEAGVSSLSEGMKVRPWSK